MSGWPNSTAAPFSTRIATTCPETPAGISLKTFIASMMQTVFSGPIGSPTLINAGEPAPAACYKVPTMGLLMTRSR
jgi:hypothetical protein